MTPARTAVALLLALAAAAACSSTSPRSGFTDEDSGAPEDASTDASVPPPIFGDAAVTKDGSTAGSRCERDMTLGKVSISNSACFVNEHVSNKKTKLEFACSGGTATATFDGHIFTGTITGDVIALTDVEKFIFNNCQWESTEKINGDLAKGTLTYTYAEKPVVSCPDQPCTAGGTVSVSAGVITVVN